MRIVYTMRFTDTKGNNTTVNGYSQQECINKARAISGGKTTFLNVTIISKRQED